MILAIDVGNSNIKLAICHNDEILFHSRLKTDIDKTEDEYMVVLFDLLAVYKVSPSQITGCIISSVVPSLYSILKTAVTTAIGCKVIIVNSGIKTGINIKIDNPSSLGSDFVAAAAGAVKKYTLPALIISLGSATTFAAVDEDKSFMGGSILPGIDISLQALAAKSAQLPSIGLDPPRSVIGTNTIDCMNSGVIFGNASLIDGMIARYKLEFSRDITVIATGGRAKNVIPFCFSDIVLDEQLIIDGLLEIYRKNKK